jgi:hypothetical protein
MTCESDKYTGRDVVVEFVPECSDSEPVVGWLKLGALRGKGLETSWDTTDLTADDSPANQTEERATFVSTTLSLDGISRGAEIANQDVLEDYVNNSADTNNFQPLGWVRVTRPSQKGGNSNKIYTFPCLFTSFSIDAPYDGGVTYSSEASAQGKISITYV